MKEKVPLPPLDAQLQIAEMLRREVRARRQVERWKMLLNEYRTRLTADVVTGKLDVREAAAKLPDIDPMADEDTFHGGSASEAAPSLDELERESSTGIET